MAAPVAEQFGHHEFGCEGNYNVRHGSQILVFSPKGESELMWKYGTEPADIADDVTTLLKKDA